MKTEIYQIKENELNDFDQLYDGTISEDDFYIIKAKLQLDEVLNHKYIVYKMLRREIELDGLSNKVLKIRLSALDQRNSNKKYKYGLVSLFSILVIVFVIMINFPQQNESKKLYNLYKESEAGLSIKMNDTYKSQINDVMIDIAKSNYTHAISKLNIITQTDTTVFYLAYCHERMSEDNLALSGYAKLTESSSATIKNKSQFRIALLHLKLNNKKAKDEMNHIANDSLNNYNLLAREIMLSIHK